MNFLQFLNEGITSESLKKSKDFQMINNLDSEFGKKLLKAWDGDFKNFHYTKDGVESLFCKMLEEVNISKFSNIKITSAVKESAKKLQLVSLRMFPPKHKPKWVDNSIWSHERIVK